MTRALYATTTDAPFQHAMRAVGGDGTYTWALEAGPPGLAMDPDGNVTFMPSGAATHEVQISVSDNGGGVAAATINLRVLPERVCLWTGASSRAFDDAGNWSFCGGAAPGATEWIAVDPHAERVPLLSASTTVMGIGPSYVDLGTIEVASGATLELTDPARTIQSSIRFAGESPTCTDCLVRITNGGYVVGDATLVLDNGIELRTLDHVYLRIGATRPAERGHLVACGEQGTLGNWPIFSSPPAGDPGHYGIRIESATAPPSTVSIDGLTLQNIHHIDGADAYMLDFVEGYRIEQLDHVRFETFYGTYDIGIRIDGCTTGEIVDTTWEDLQLEMGTDSRTVNVNVACDPGIPICIPDATGAAAGEGFENDPFDVVDWSGTCP
jgi:hypothetical protein